MFPNRSTPVAWHGQKKISRPHFAGYQEYEKNQQKKRNEMLTVRPAERSKALRDVVLFSRRLAFFAPDATERCHARLDDAVHVLELCSQPTKLHRRLCGSPARLRRRRVLAVAAAAFSDNDSFTEASASLGTAGGDVTRRAGTRGSGIRYPSLSVRACRSCAARTRKS